MPGICGQAASTWDVRFPYAIDAQAKPQVFPCNLPNLIADQAQQSSWLIAVKPGTLHDGYA
jgi:hypothetical protein